MSANIRMTVDDAGVWPVPTAPPVRIAAVCTSRDEQTIGIFILMEDDTYKVAELKLADLAAKALPVEIKDAEAFEKIFAELSIKAHPAVNQ